MIQNHMKDLLREDLGSKKIKRSRKQPDDVTIMSSGRLCFSTTSNVARALKMRVLRRNRKQTSFNSNMKLLSC